MKGENKVEALKNENEGLKGKLETQIMEIQSLKSQIKLMSALDDTRKVSGNTQRDTTPTQRSSHLSKRDLQKSRLVSLHGNNLIS